MTGIGGRVGEEAELAEGWLKSMWTRKKVEAWQREARRT